jgi:hypothetical protein
MDLNDIYKLPLSLTWLPVGLIVTGLIFNTLMSVVLLVSKEVKRINCFKYLAVIGIFDTLCLFTWNLNQFLRPNFDFEIENLNVSTCRIFLYLQYVSLQINSVLRSLLCIERYYFVMKLTNPYGWLGKKLFGTPHSVAYWIITVSISISALNFHLLFNNGTNVKHYKDNKTELRFNCYHNKFINIRPTWSRMNLLISATIPSTIMLIFNSLLIYKTYLAKLQLRRISFASRVSFYRARRFTASLIFISIMYLLTHTPVNIIFSFFMPFIYTKKGIIVSFCFILLQFSQHSFLFFELYFTNSKFRKVLKNFFIRKKQNGRDKFRLYRGKN